jgi:hypothetical protein
MSARVIMICLDGADGKMLDQYSTDGSLPNLTALRLQGAARSLSAPSGSTDDALWASFQYTLNLGEHGRYYLLTPQRNNRLGMAHESEDFPTFWDKLSRQGMHVAVLDVPKCREPRPLNGIHLVDWLTHGECFQSPHSYPPSLVEEVSQNFGPRPAHQCHYLEMEIDKKEPDKVLTNAMAGIAMKRSAGLHYLNSATWDLFCIGFSQMHCINHKFWDLDSIPPIDDLRALNKPIFEVLQGIDESIGALVSAAGSEAERIVFAPTDFERSGSWQHLMPEVVARINAKLSTQFGRPALLNWLSTLKLKVLRRLTRRGPETWWGDRGTWPCTILPFNSNCLAIRIAASGERRLYRDSSSALPASALLDAVEKELLDLRAQADGIQAIVSTTRPSLSHRGAYANNLPDLLVHYPSGYFPDAVRSPSIGRVEMQAPAWRKGDHRDGGFVIASGQESARLLARVQTISDIGKLAQDVCKRHPKAV